MAPLAGSYPSQSLWKQSWNWEAWSWEVLVVRMRWPGFRKSKCCFLFSLVSMSVSFTLRDFFTYVERKTFCKHIIPQVIKMSSKAHIGIFASRLGGFLFELPFGACQSPQNDVFFCSRDATRDEELWHVKPKKSTLFYCWNGKGVSEFQVK